jgi:hypothetical protein
MRAFACWCSIILLLAAGAAREARGQNAQRPPPLPDAGWSAVVAQFAQSLVSNDPGAIAPLLSDAANVHSMDGRTSDPLRLLASARQCTLVSARSYVHAPPSAAGDIAEAFRDATVPGDVKDRMIPVDNAELVRANGIAAQWLKESLHAAPGDRVAIVVLWSPEAANAGGGGGSADPINGVSFVLLKGTTTDSEAKVQTVVFGNPRLY